MPKVSRGQMLLLALVVALIGLSAYCVVVVVQQVSGASELEGEIAEVEEAIAKINAQYDVEGLQAQLDSLKAELEQAEFPAEEDVEAVKVLDLVIDAEHDAGIQVDSFWPEDPTTVSLNDNGMTYTAFIHALTAMSADVAGVYEFLDAVETNSPFETLIIDNVALEFIPATEDEPAHWSTECDIIVYARN